MTKISETIVFFGSGPVAASSLAKLAQDFPIEAVITKPQPPHHKDAFPVLELANKLSLKTLTPQDKAQVSELFKTKPLSSKLGVVIDYGILIERSVIDSFDLGIVNSHFSLLPRWRGADPISFAILNGDENTGVSLMLITDALDEGPLLAQRELNITEGSTTSSLTRKLVDLSHDLLVETLPAYVSGQLQPYPQATSGISYSRKLTKQDAQLDWHKSAIDLERQIRAYQQWPRSRTTLGKYDVLVTASHALSGDGRPGSLWQAADQLGVYTSDGILVIDKLIPAGKKEMLASAFLLGYKL